MAKERFFIPQLDSLRFFAFILIFIHHLGPTNILFVENIKNIGWLGVDIFFCLSAFLLTQILRAEVEKTGTLNIRNFYIRRILRIWPLYLIYCIIAIIFSCYKDVLTFENWNRSVGLLTFSDNIFVSLYDYNPILFTGHLWTLSYEEQFYLALPFLILFLVKRNSDYQRNLFLIIIMIGGSLIRLFFIYNNVNRFAIWVLPITHFESILFGVFLGFRKEILKTINLFPWLLIAAVSILIIFLLPSNLITSYYLMILYPCIGVLSGSLVCIFLYSRSEIYKTLLSNKVSVYLGKISFGLYVFHIFCILLTDFLSPYLNLNNVVLKISISLSLTIILASISYLLLEKRFLTLKDNFTTVPSKPI